MREYKKKTKEKRATINLGREGDPFRDLFEKKCRGMSVTAFFRDAVFTMHSNDPVYKRRKIDYLKQKLLVAKNDIAMLVDERDRIQEQLIEAGASEEEIWEVLG